MSHQRYKIKLSSFRKLNLYVYLLTEHFKSLEPQHPLIGKFYVVQKRRSADFVATVYWYVRSGYTRIPDFPPSVKARRTGRIKKSTAQKVWPNLGGNFKARFFVSINWLSYFERKLSPPREWKPREKCVRVILFFIFTENRQQMSNLIKVKRISNLNAYKKKSYLFLAL